MMPPLKNLLETLIVGSGSAEQFLPMEHPSAVPLRNAAVNMAGVSRVAGEYEVIRTGARYHVVLFTLGGQGKLEGEAASHRLGKDTMAIIPAGVPHRYTLAGNSWTIAWFHLSRRRQWRALENQEVTVAASRLGERLRDLALIFSDEVREGRETDARLAAELLARTLRRALSADESDPHEERLRSLLRAVEENPSHEWSVEELARMAHVSSQHLYRLTARCWGGSPMTAVVRIRMERAEALLRHTDLTIERIAEHVGYSDAFAFSSAFKREKGIRPRNYRNRERSP